MNLKSSVTKYAPHGIGLWIRETYAKKKKSISQMGQDFWVFGEAFNGKESGFFVEIGSADGIFLNNTFLLEKRFHWRGICVEPNPALFRDLVQVRSARCLNVCLDAAEGEVEFAPNGLLGGIVGDDTDNRRKPEAPLVSGIMKLKTTTLLSVLKAEQAPPTIDYLSIDVEGSEDRILNNFPFDEYTFSTMTVERPKQQLRDVLARRGYKNVREIPNHDVFYVHESFLPVFEKNVFEFWATHATW